MRIERLTRTLGTAGVIALATALAWPQASSAQSSTEIAKPQEAAAEASVLVADAKKAVEEFRKSEVAAKFHASVRSGRAVLIVPKFERAGLGLGGEGGTGVMLKKLPGAGGWTYPAFFEIGGPTLGAQIGYEKGTLLIVIHNQQTLNEIMNGELSFGAEARALAGSKGVVAQTTRTGGNQIDLFMQGAGAFAGAMVKGGDIRPVKKLNAGYYGKGAAPANILRANGRKNTHADGLRAALSALAAAPAPVPTN